MTTITILLFSPVPAYFLRGQKTVYKMMSTVYYLSLVATYVDISDRGMSDCTCYNQETH